MDRRKDEQLERDRRRERKGTGNTGEHPGAHGEKQRVPENPKQDRTEPPIGNGAVDEPAAFPPHN